MGSRTSPKVYRFGEYVLDARAFSLSRADEPLHLEPKAFAVLVYLLERHGELVCKDELKRDVWPDVAVTDGALTRVVAQLRRVLEGRGGRGGWIETVPTKGYRFAGAVEPVDVQNRQPLDAARPPDHRVRHVMAALAIVAATVIAIVALTWRHDMARADPESAAPPIRTLAVLPFRNLSGDEAQEYLADGISQALADTLSRFRVFDVVSTTSTFRYKSSPASSDRIASELGADGLVEGDVVRGGSHLHATVALVDGRSARRLWTGAYDIDDGDGLALSRDLALRIVRELKVAADTVTFIRSREQALDPEAADAYLRAMSLMGNGWMAGGCRDAEMPLREAIARAPTFAAAHAALAWCYEGPDRLGRGIDEVRPTANAAVERALALDDHLAIAHAVAGSLKWLVDFDPAAAEPELRYAVDLDRNSGIVLMPAAQFFLWRGDPDTALPLLDRVLRLDPFSSDRHTAVGHALMKVGRYDAAVPAFQRALELDPRSATARFWLAETFAYQERRDAAVAEYLKWLGMVLRPERSRAAMTALAEAFARRGWTGFWRLELALAEEEARRPGSLWIVPYNRYAGSWYLARRYARLGRWDRALEELDRSYRERHHLVVTMNLEPLFAPLRARAPFRDLLRKTRAPNSP